jgi:hypothetical protein
MALIKADITKAIMERGGNIPLWVKIRAVNDALAAAKRTIARLMSVKTKNVNDTSRIRRAVSVPTDLDCMILRSGRRVPKAYLS